MNVRLLKLRLLAYQGYRKPREEGDDGGDTTTVDRGDSWTPTDEDAPKPTAQELADAALAQQEADEAAAAEAAKKGKDKTEPEVKTDGKTDDGKTDDDKSKPKIIPLDRHEKILAKERAAREDLERQLKNFQGQTKVADTNEQLTKLENDVVELEKQYTKLISDGEAAKAAEIMGKIRRTERQINDTKTEWRVSAATAIATEQARYDIALERVEEAYPQLNEDSPEFDAELMQDVVDMKAMYQQRGDTATKALQKAVAKLVKPVTTEQKESTEVTPRVTEADLAAQRKKDAVSATADAVKRTPPNTAKVGQDSDKMGGGLNAKDVMKMPQEEFAKLSEEALSKMRGDTL